MDTMTYRIGKDGKLFIYWHDHMVRMLSGAKAIRLMERLTEAEPDEVELLLRKETTNLKRKNEGDKQTLVIRGVHYTR